MAKQYKIIKNVQYINKSDLLIVIYLWFKIKNWVYYRILINYGAKN